MKKARTHFGRISNSDAKWMKNKNKEIRWTRMGERGGLLHCALKRRSLWTNLECRARASPKEKMLLLVVVVVMTVWTPGHYIAAARLGCFCARFGVCIIFLLGPLQITLRWNNEEHGPASKRELCRLEETSGVSCSALKSRPSALPKSIAIRCFDRVAKQDDIRPIVCCLFMSPASSCSFVCTHFDEFLDIFWCFLMCFELSHFWHTSP